MAGNAPIPGATDGLGATAQFAMPSGITTDGTNLYITEIYNNTIRKIVIASGEVTTVAGTAGFSGATDATGNAARFNWPNDITTDGANLYIVDHSNFTIRKIVIATGVVTTFAGKAGVYGSTDGSASEALFNRIMGITMNGTSLYITDFGAIREILL